MALCITWVRWTRESKSILLSYDFDHLYCEQKIQVIQLSKFLSLISFLKKIKYIRYEVVCFFIADFRVQ